MEEDIPAACTARYRVEFTELQQLLTEQASLGSARRATTAGFLLAVLRLGAARDPQSEWFERQAQAREVLALLEKDRPLGADISKEMHQLLGKPYTDP